MRTKTLWMALALAVLLVANAAVVSAGGNARRPAIESGANQVVQLQRSDTDWEGTWYWYVGSTSDATNLTGITALGLLEAFRDVKDPAYLDAAIAAADFIQVHLGAGATGTQHHVRTTAPDVIFLHRLSEVTGENSYAARAKVEWTNLKGTFPTAAALDTLFRNISRRSAWDMAFFLEAAHLSGDTTWANDAAAILASTTDTFYYGDDTGWYALNLAGAVRSLVGSGYYEAYSWQVVEHLSNLIGLVDDENGIGGWVQDTAYAVLALNSVGGAGRSFSNQLGRWLARQQQANGGWLEPDGNEYPEADGEAVRALASTIGSNVTLDGFEPGTPINSSWIKVVHGKAAEPFNGD